ncbi:imidazolonepropionase-like amidohydrolase [Jejuia pallidilutea]|uniref:Imidazolonepropionase-like amidohydrolase n=1 Tax=Jejuia pallidilutea TaxID=504487 RepID=A0A362WYG6_9FLAO|nr:amidohydrolase family protein [Jejuia pallidilutea]PQV46889.1 imidazolonepropionase-like amidohydrolase [Jejuia pallidilutea]
MKLFNLYIVLTCLLLLNGLNAQQTPAKPQSEPITIEGATAHLGNGKVINNALIMFEAGKITFIGSANTKIARKGKIIDAKGKHVYPGFIIPNSTLGLVEIDAVRATDDDAEIGTWNPHIRSLIAYNAESKVVESMRPNGVLLGQITPRGSRISGTSSIVQFDAWNWEDAAVKVDDGIHMSWPNNFTQGRWWMGEDPGLKPNKDYSKHTKTLADYFDEAKAYLNSNKQPKHLPFEALAGIFNGSKTLYINVDDEKGILDAITFIHSHNLKNVVLVSARDAHMVADVLKTNNIPVVLNRVHSTPNKDDDDYDLPYKSAKLLVEKGIKVALQANGQMERMNTRNLPFYAGTVAAHGLDKEVALQLITLNAAEILGIDDAYGSLENGKSATLFISEGDALDMRTNKLTHAFIDGRMISLETHQTELWKRYSGKYTNE